MYPRRALRISAFLSCLVIALWLPAEAGAASSAVPAEQAPQLPKSTAPQPSQAKPTAPAQAAPPNDDAPGAETGKLSGEAKVALVRYVYGEYARAVEPLPSGKKGITVMVGQPPDTNGLLKQAHFDGLAANKGDTVQITGLVFHAKQIVFEINGGGKRHFHPLEHLSIGASTDPAPISVADGRSHEGQGCTITLDYGRDLPNLTPDDVKRDLGYVLDFSNQRSSTANWVETIAPEFRQAITEHKAVVGMDEDMVIAAIGRPDHKVRQRDDTGTETEDWIYGEPPGKTIFVTFAAAKVIRVKEFD